MILNLDKSDRLYFVSAIKYTALLATALHLILLVYFWIIELSFFSIIHFIGAVFFLIMYYWLKKTEKALLIFNIMFIQIILQSILSAILMGTESGFLTYIPVLTVLFLLNPKWDVKMVIYFFIFNLIVFISSYYLISHHQPILSLPAEKVRNIYLLNLTLVTIGGFGLLVFFKYLNVANSKVLIDANNTLHKKNLEIDRQYRKQKILLKEIHHRVKNNLQIISSMLSLQKYKLNDEKMIDILENSQARIHAISIIHQKLFQQDDLAVVNLNFYLKDLCDSLNYLNPNIKCSIDAIDLPLNLDIAVPLGLITSEILSNSYKHAFDKGAKGSVKIQLTMLENPTSNKLLLLITDNGKGFHKDFDPAHSSGLGMEIINTLSEQIEAKVAFQNTKNGAQSSIELNLPNYRLIG